VRDGGPSTGERAQAEDVVVVSPEGRPSIGGEGYSTNVSRASSGWSRPLHPLRCRSGVRLQAERSVTGCVVKRRA
jgi:hypothetical protein